LVNSNWRPGDKFYLSTPPPDIKPGFRTQNYIHNQEVRKIILNVSGSIQNQYNLSWDITRNPGFMSGLIKKFVTELELMVNLEHVPATDPPNHGRRSGVREEKAVNRRR
jgi:hypothetical protein